METPDRERHEFVFMDRRILEYVSGSWTLPGNVPMFPADINEKLRVRFPRGSAWDIIGWGRFQPVENLQVVMESVVHAVLAQPSGEVTWPTVFLNQCRKLSPVGLLTSDTCSREQNNSNIEKRN